MEFRPYLDSMEEKDNLAYKALHRCFVLNETMAKRTPEIAQNAINFLNFITNEQLHTLEVKDRIMVIMWAIRVICKHNFVNNVKTKAEEMKNATRQMKIIFQPLFKIGLPAFWDPLGRLVPVTGHQPTLLATKMDSLKLDEMPGTLSGSTLCNRLTNDFRILHQFRNLREFMSPMSYTQCIKLEILLKEMTDYEVLQWKQVERLSRRKYNIAGSSVG